MRASWSFSAGVYATSGVCSPSRSVVSISWMRWGSVRTGGVSVRDSDPAFGAVNQGALARTAVPASGATATMRA
jgi:hypothetical protein